MSKCNIVILAILLGNAIGMVIGPISVISIIARDVLRGGEQWPDFKLEHLLTLWLFSIPAGINGAIGMWAAIAYRDFTRNTVLLLPIGLHLLSFPLSILIQPQSAIGIQLYLLVFTVIMFASGRLAQHVAKTLFSQEPDKPDIEITQQ